MANDTIKPGVLKTIHELGMPFFESPFRFGNLYINFNIIFPDSLTDKEVELVTDALAVQKSKSEPVTKFQESYTVSNFKLEDENTHCQGGKKEAYKDQEDEEEGEQQGGVRCQQQ